MCHANDVVPYGTNEKSESERFRIFGLPERIRTAGLQSRSLTRYPAVPRADITVIDYTISYAKSKEFFPVFKKIKNIFIFFCEYLLTNAKTSVIIRFVN